MNPRTFPAGQAHKLDDSERFTWLPQAEAVALLALRPGMAVADVGAGTGYFALPMAQAVGEAGRVYAVDFQPEMLDRLRARLAAPDAPRNIEPVAGQAARTGLPEGSCDLVLMANLWHELDDHPAVLREAARLLKPDGRLAILDWRANVDRPPGPPLEHRIPVENAIHTLEHAGWTLHHCGEVGSYSYLLIFTLTDESVQS